MSRITRTQAAAVTAAQQARGPAAFARAHLAMRRAFPELARAYPCDCSTCTDARAKGKHVP